jgi:hypothetical protein
MHRCLTLALWTQTHACEKTLTVAVSKAPAGHKPLPNPSHEVTDKCDKAWWRAHKQGQNEPCEKDCGWVVDWQGMAAEVIPHPKNPPPPPEKSGSGVVVAIVVVVVLAVLVRRLRFESARPIAFGLTRLT